jgi:polyhydroxybutyrate depolymerase
MACVDIIGVIGHPGSRGGDAKIAPVPRWCLDVSKREGYAMKVNQKALLVLLGLVPCLCPMSSALAKRPGGDGSCTIQAGADCAFTLTVDGRAREYLLHVPDGYNGSAVPLVIDVHGYTSTPEAQRDASGMYQLSDVQTFAVAYPRGGPITRSRIFDKGFNGSADWVDPGCCGTPAIENWNDVAMILAVKNDIASKMNINKFYYTGLSNGSYMGHRLLCQAPDAFDAYAITSAALSDSWDDCIPSQARPVLYMHGRNDTTQPIGGSSDIAGEYVLSTANTMAIYAFRNNCLGYPASYVETFVVGTSWCREYSGCNVSVAYCELESGHVTYGATGLDVAAAFWDFFRRH